MDEFVPYLISWNLTQRCNLRCQHCYIDASQAAPGELSTAEALRVLDEIAAVTPETMLILTGGEPLCRPDLEALVARATQLGMTVVLGTNGTTLTPERALSLKAAGALAVGISLDSLDAGQHDRFRGQPGAWEQTQRGIAAAHAAGLEVQIQCTLTRDNIGELDDIVEHAKAHAARVLTVFFLVCTGRGQGLVDLTPEEYEMQLGRLATLEGGGVMVRPRCAPTFRRVLAQRDPDSLLLQSDTARCLAAKNYCRITPAGDVTPCPYMPLTAGNLRAQSFGEIWRTSRVLTTLREPALQGDCGECEYRELCGGCRARAYAQTGDALAADPWCVYEPGTDAPLQQGPSTAMRWTAEAEQRLKRAPFFVRRMVRKAVESLAAREGIDTVTVELMDRARRTLAGR